MVETCIIGLMIAALILALILGGKEKFTQASQVHERLDEIMPSRPSGKRVRIKILGLPENLLKSENLEVKNAPIAKRGGNIIQFPQRRKD